MLKGRKIVSVFMLGILSLLLLLSVSVPITFTTRAFVPYSLDKTMEQLEQPAQLGKWFLPFAASDPREVHRQIGSKAGIYNGSHALTVQKSSPGNAILSFENDGYEKDYQFIVSRDGQGKKHCIVTLGIMNTVWKRLIDPDPLDNMVIRSMRNLEKFTNDTKQYYGYTIQRKKATDSSFLYMSVSADSDNASSKARMLFDALIRYAMKNSMDYTGKRIYYSQPNADSLQIFASIAVNSGTEPPANEGIARKSMPAGTQLLVAEYRGPYGEVDAVYKALEQYKRDYQLVSMSVPFEEYETPGYGFTPTDTVALKVCYPIF